ncbi:uncharacterized protein LOC143184016 [Calliopsis andreniformis]|uniref:uncharacterized protein LOC143184016 n=1 Tax=Calliopsis andreniformis TaxID=337506 RepID=UPI003FCDFD69
MEEVTKCRYIDCLEAREKEQILHELPVCDTGLCVRWLINSGHVDLIGKDLDALRSMKFFICNNHFTEDCYLSKGTLKENAVPSPHWSTVSRTLKTSKARLLQKVQLNGKENSMEEAPVNQSSEQNGPSEFEVDQWCRTCATKKHNLVSMTTKGKGTEMSLLSKLKLLIEIDDEDALPTKMCNECVDKLEQSFKFFQQIYVADNTLRHVFPNARLNSMPRKPLYSLSEHMRREQKEREKEKEKEEEQQDQTPKITRGGIFRRGRGRPRSRGYGGRGRSRGRPPSYSTMALRSLSLNDNRIVSPTFSPKNDVRTPVITKDEPESKEVLVLEEDGQSSTVFSLLTDTCRSDEELDWSDVLKVMNREGYRCSKEDEERLEPSVEKKEQAEQAVEAKNTEKVETVEKKEETEPRPEAEMEMEVEAKTEAEPRSDEKASLENDIRRIRCEFCDKAFKFRRQLQAHLLADHSQFSGYMCTDCLACYESESLLSKHRALRHGERRYRCEHCQEEFLEKRVLREHVNECRPHNTVDYPCSSCTEVFTSEQHLLEHMKHHPESPVAESFQLNLSDSKNADELASFSEANQLVPEESTTVPTPSEANVTLESSTNEDGNVTCSNSTSEANTEQKQSNEEAICPDCNEKMSDAIELSIHRMRRHTVKRKDATCLLCDNRTFSSAEEYEQHVLDHCKRLRVSP